MQPENPCPLHSNKQVSFICLTKDCHFQRLFCDTCKPNHYMHNFLPYDQFEKLYNKFQEIVQKNVKKINEQFTKIKQTFAICIKRTQDKIIKQIITCSSIPKLNDLQFQQRFGIISQVIRNQRFCRLIDQEKNFQFDNKNQNKYLEDLNIYLEEMNTNIMASINKFMSQFKIAIDTYNISIKKQNLMASLVQLPKQYFKFSQKYKPEQYEISENNTCVTRHNPLNEGLSMYCVIQQPLTKQNNMICFTITHQTRRFIYFGVCDRQNFKKFLFKGALYEKGNRMYSIRQSVREGSNAVTLHNSKDEFSNKDHVPWDFKTGDIICLKYVQDKNILIFIKNGTYIFEMPLDKEIQKLYPFVGLKYQNDSVKILSSKKKGFFSLFE